MFEVGQRLWIIKYDNVNKRYYCINDFVVFCIHIYDDKILYIDEHSNEEKYPNYDIFIDRGAANKEVQRRNENNN